MRPLPGGLQSFLIQSIPPGHRTQTNIYLSNLHPTNTMLLLHPLHPLHPLLLLLPTTTPCSPNHPKEKKQRKKHVRHQNPTAHTGRRWQRASPATSSRKALSPGTTTPPRRPHHPRPRLQAPSSRLTRSVVVQRRRRGQHQRRPRPQRRSSSSSSSSITSITSSRKSRSSSLARASSGPRRPAPRPGGTAEGRLTRELGSAVLLRALGPSGRLLQPGLAERVCSRRLDLQLHFAPGQCRAGKGPRSRWRLEEDNTDAFAR
jgi:hypothetical protein